MSNFKSLPSSWILKNGSISSKQNPQICALPTISLEAQSRIICMFKPFCLTEASLTVRTLTHVLIKLKQKMHHSRYVILHIIITWNDTDGIIFSLLQDDNFLSNLHYSLRIFQTMFPIQLTFS